MVTIKSIEEHDNNNFEQIDHDYMTQKTEFSHLTDFNKNDFINDTFRDSMTPENHKQNLQEGPTTSKIL
tara:strand:+ start:1366 stop:1572 length:207 start_codon:yes stop_codon:yes gene_type:complete